MISPTTTATPVFMGVHVHYIFGLWDSQRVLPEFMRRLVAHNETVLSKDQFRQTIWYREEIENLFEEAGHKAVWEYLRQHVPRKVVWADLARYLVLWRRGGLYLDLDVRVNHDLGPVLLHGVDGDAQDESSCSCDVMLFTEHDRCNPERMGPLEDRTQTRRMYNCMMYCDTGVDGREFFRRCFEVGVDRVKRMVELRKVKAQSQSQSQSASAASMWSMSDTDVLWASGPDVVTSVYHEYVRRTGSAAAAAAQLQTQPQPRIHVLPHEPSVKLLTHLQAGTWKQRRDQTS
eukprot:693256-Prorocentrum_minimum.AAC.15